MQRASQKPRRVKPLQNAREKYAMKDDDEQGKKSLGVYGSNVPHE